MVNESVNYNEGSLVRGQDFLTPYILHQQVYLYVRNRLIRNIILELEHGWLKHISRLLEERGKSMGLRSRVHSLTAKLST